MRETPYKTLAQYDWVVIRTRIGCILSPFMKENILFDAIENELNMPN